MVQIFVGEIIFEVGSSDFNENYRAYLYTFLEEN